MGVFDYRCVATDLPLTVSRVVFVAMMEVEPGRFAPVSLPVAGVYDSYGRVERFTADFRIIVLSNGLEEAAKAGRIAALDQSLDALNRTRPVTPESAIDMIERCTTMSTWSKPEECSLRVDGKLLQHCYFEEKMFKAIIGTAAEVPKKEPTSAEVKALVTQAFPDAFGAWLHRDLHKLSGPSLRKVFAAMNEVIAVADFMRAHDLKWRHPETGQFGYAERYLANLSARKKFASHAPLQKALLAHAKETEAWAAEDVRDEEAARLPEHWARDGAVAWYGLHAGLEFVATTSLATLRALVHEWFARGLTEVIAVERGVVVKRVDLKDKREAAGPLWDWLEQELPALHAPLAKQDTLVWPELQPWGGYQLHTCARRD